MSEDEYDALTEEEKAKIEQKRLEIKRERMKRYFAQFQGTIYLFVNNKCWQHLFTYLQILIRLGLCTGSLYQITFGK